MLEKVYLGIISLIYLDYLVEVRLNYFITVGLKFFFLFYSYSWNFCWSSLKFGTYFTLFLSFESSYLRIIYSLASLFISTYDFIFISCKKFGKFLDYLKYFKFICLLFYFILYFLSYSIFSSRFSWTNQGIGLD